MVMIDRAIMLAAGMSTRLRPLTNDLPKTLLRINDTTIFDTIVSILQLYNIRDLVVVSGYAHDKLIEHAKNKDIDITFIINEKLGYDNIYSFYLAKDYMDRDFILLNSDIVFHPMILYSLLNLSGSRLAINDNKELDYEDMKVMVINDVVKDIGKDIKEANGEYIGLMKFEKEEINKVLKVIEDLFKEQRYNLYYEDAIRLIANRYDCFYKCSTNNLPYVEIDTIEDLENSKKIVDIIKRYLR